MSLQTNYPGVYVEEIPSGMKTINGVSTSITAFIGRAKKGKVNNPIAIFNYKDYERIFGGLWKLSSMSFAVRDFFLNGGQEAVIVRVHKEAKFVKIEIDAESGGSKLKLKAFNPGTWAENMEIIIDYDTMRKENGSVDDTLFNITLSSEDGISEKYFNVTINTEKSKSIDKVLAQNSDLITVETLSNMRPNKGTYYLPKSTGNDGQTITDNELYGANMQTEKKGIYALDNTDIFNLLCIPPYRDGNKDVTLELIEKASAYCKDRRAILLVDPNSSWKSINDVVNDVSNPNKYLKLVGINAALYFPLLLQANPLMNNEIEEFAPCGSIAGIIARTDRERGIWKSPAGTDATILGAHGLRVSLTDEENGYLDPLGVNCLREFPIYGKVVWGARTLAGADIMASEWKYLPVRRTALFIEESLFRGLNWVVFEPNGEPLWGKIRLQVGAFMHILYRQGAFQGIKKDAYFVKCDSETTTQNDINLGIVNIVVGFAPLKPAEFIILKIQIPIEN